VIFMNDIITEKDVLEVPSFKQEVLVQPSGDVNSEQDILAEFTSRPGLDSLSWNGKVYDRNWYQNNMNFYGFTKQDIDVFDDQGNEIIDGDEADEATE